MKCIEGPIITFEWHGMEIINPTVSECGRFAISPRHYGFYIAQTGGGCTAWRKEILGDEYVLLTDADGMDHELTEGGSAIYGRYDEDDEQLALWEIEVGVGYTRGEIEGR